MYLGALTAPDAIIKGYQMIALRIVIISAAGVAVESVANKTSVTILVITFS